MRSIGVHGSPPDASNRPANAEAGFTLVEALIAIVILAVGLMAVANLFAVATTSNAAGSHSTAATVQATEVMERLRAIPFAGLAAGGSLAIDTGSLGANCNDNPPAGNCVIGTNYNALRVIPGVGSIKTRWVVTDTGAGVATCHVRVVSESEGPLVRSRSRADFTTIRTCTGDNPPCPASCP